MASEVMNAEKVLAIIPARSGSKGLPGKNLRMMHGKPLVAYPILSAKNSNCVDFVYCSTDSKEIADYAISYGADASYLRPSHLSDDYTTSVEVVRDALIHFANRGQEFTYVIMLEPTSPLTTSNDIDFAFQYLKNESEDFDSAISITKSISGHPDFTFFRDVKGRIEPYMGFPWHFRRRQDLSPAFFQTGSFYLSKVDALMSSSSFITSRTLGIVVPKVKAFEIDDKVDFIIVERIFSYLESQVD
jgi:CMP-N,N'-diacetyllegionaminic acid synthase